MGTEQAVSEKILETLAIDDGLELELVDLSRRLAGDRWQVVLEVRGEVPLPITDEPNGDVALLRRVFGSHAPYVHRYERNFVDEKEKEAVLADMAAEFEANVLPYLKREGMAARIIQAKARDVKQNFRKYGLSPGDVS